MLLSLMESLCVHNTRSSSRATYVQPFASTNTYQHSFPSPFHYGTHSHSQLPLPRQYNPLNVAF